MMMFKQMTILAIKAYVREKGTLDEAELKMLEEDNRKGVEQIVLGLREASAAQEQEHQRLLQMLQYEQALWSQGFQRVLGMDEVGRGPLAGPVAVGGVIMPRNRLIPGVNDSKLLSASQRTHLSELIKQEAIGHMVASRDQSFIDQHGINAAIISCQLELVEKLKPDYLLLDAFPLPQCPLPQQAIIKGDSKSLSIAAASIIAKVHRDCYMEEMALTYPGYGFESHKGYGSKSHREAIAQLGLCPLHRKSFLGNIEINNER